MILNQCQTHKVIPYQSDDRKASGQLLLGYYADSAQPTKLVKSCDLAECKFYHLTTMLDFV